MDAQLKQCAVYRSLYGVQALKSSQSYSASNAASPSLSKTLDVIEHLGYVQIDTISVVERAHHHTLWSRVDNYHKDNLNNLLENKKIFEYWFHAASYLPMRDYRFALRQMNAVRRGEIKYFNRGDSYLMREITAQARSEGAIRSRDFAMMDKPSSQAWWKSGIVKNSIEQLYMQGDLIVSQRSGVEKIYSLTEDYLPLDIDLTEPSLDEYAHYLFETVKRSQGVFTWKQLIHLKTGSVLKQAMLKVLEEQIDAKLIQQIYLSSGESMYVDLEAMELASNIPKEVKILSPFDNLVIHRDRLRSLFNFDYRLECYVKPEKRQYGYFCLPVLYGTDFVAKIDCKVHRDQGILEIVNFYILKTIVNRSDFLERLIVQLEEFALFNHCRLDHSIHQKIKL